MLYAHRGRFKSAVNGTGSVLRLQQSFNCQFDGLVTIERHSGSNTSTFAAGLTLTSASSDIKPAGFINCDISGTFTGPTNSFQCDGTTYKRFLNNSGVLAGGATVNLLEPASVLTPKGIYVNGAVAVTGNGSFTFPFKTITEALAIVAAGDVVHIASGTYTENLTLPNIDNISIIGAGKNCTIIDAVSASTTPTMKWAPLTGSYTKLTLKGFTLRNTNNSQYCLQLDGDGTAVAGIAQFLSTCCLIQDVICDKVTSTGDGFYFRSVDKLFIYDGNGSTITGNVAGWNCSGQFLNTGYCFISNTIVGNGLTGFTYTYDNTGGVIKPKGGRQGLNLANGSTIYGTLTLTKAPLFSMAQDTVIFGDIDATSLAIFTSPAHAPSIRIAGSIGSPGLPSAVSVTMPAITAPMVAAGAIPYVDLSDAVVWGSATKKVTMTGTAGGALRFGPFAHRARFENIPPLSAVNVIAAAETDFDIKGSAFVQSLIGSTGNGTVDRDRHLFSAVSVGALAFVPSFPSTVAATSYIVAVQPTTTGTDVAITLKTSTGFTLSGVGTADLIVIRTP